MSIEIHRLLARGVFATYGYFIVDGNTRHGFLVDPGAQAGRFMEAVAENGWTIEAILLTHGHFDHMGAAGELREALGIPIMAHAEAQRYLTDARLNLSAEYGSSIVVPDVQTFEDDDVLSLEANPAVSLRVLHVPGHTDDSCAFYCENGSVAFVGDTVYEGGPGLTAFLTGDAARLRQSIRDKLLALPPDTMLLSGHSRSMTVARLRQAIRS